MNLSKIDRPETPAEAMHWQQLRNQYDQLGLCPTCTAQLAYAHQHGPTAVEAPCPTCVAVMATWNAEDVRPDWDGVNGWRLWRNERAKRKAAKREAAKVAVPVAA